MIQVSKMGPDAFPDDAQGVFHHFVTEYGPYENQAKVLTQRPRALKHFMGLLLGL